MEYLCHSPAETEALGERLGKQLRPGALIAYEGGLGMGKAPSRAALRAGLAAAAG